MGIADADADGDLDLVVANREGNSATYLANNGDWMPIISVVDDRTALMAGRQASEVHGHWSTGPAFVAGARLALEQFRQLSA